MAFSPERRRKTEINPDLLSETKFAMVGLENLKPGGGLLIFNPCEAPIATLALSKIFLLQQTLNFTDNVSLPSQDILLDIRRGKLVCLALDNKADLGDLGFRISRHGYTVIPLAIWQTEDNVVHFNIGKPFAIFAKQALGATLMAEGVARLLPQYNKPHESQ